MLEKPGKKAVALRNKWLLWVKTAAGPRESFHSLTEGNPENLLLKPSNAGGCQLKGLWESGVQLDPAKSHSVY